VHLNKHPDATFSGKHGDAEAADEGAVSCVLINFA
jgi:hypothetical protein